MAAGIGGFAKGFAGGMRLQSDMQDAEARRELMALQKEAASLQLEELKDDRAYKTEYKTTVQNIFGDKQETTPVPAAGIANPAAAPVATDAQPTDGTVPAAGGIALPGEAPAQAPAAPKPNAGLSDFEKTAKAFDALKQLDMKYGRLKPVEALKQARDFEALRQEGVLDAFRYYAGSGDGAGALERFNSMGGQKAPDGTIFKTEMREVVPGVPESKRPDYVAVMPDGRTVSYQDVLRSTLKPSDLARLDTETGLGVAKLALMKTAEENAAKRHTEIYDLTKMKYDRMIGEQKAQTDIALRRLNLAEDDAKYQRVQTAFTGSFAELTNSLGVNKKFDPMMAGDKEKQEHMAKLLAASSAQSIFEMNFDLKKNSAGVTPQAALNVWKSAVADPGQVKLDKETGLHYIQQGSKSIFVPSSLAPKATAENAQPAAGIATPGTARPQAAPTAPAAPAPNRMSDSLSDAAQQSGAALDQAKARVAEASANVQRFGLRQRQQDPQGFTTAQQALAQAQRDLAASEAAYQANLPRGLTTAFPR